MSIKKVKDLSLIWIRSHPYNAIAGKNSHIFNDLQTRKTGQCIDVYKVFPYIIHAGDDFGFDCIISFIVACRVCCQLVKNGRSNVTANDNFALAA
jgi:hypothetical protein